MTQLSGVATWPRSATLSAEDRLWLRCYRTSADPALRLVCFPHAGGVASRFSTWAPLLPDQVELLAVCYPARHDRFLEEPVERMADLVAALLPSVLRLLDRPLVLFGHSMGASVAHEVALELEKIGAPPKLLMVSGRRAPHRLERGTLCEGGDEAVLAEVRRYGGQGSEAIDDPELRELVLPALRGDYRLVDHYVPGKRPPISAPVIAYAGQQDEDNDPAELRDWAVSTSGGFDLKAFPGGHFYLDEHQDALVADIRRRLGPLLGTA
jgi:pyochelin biosynthetic protein PchC